MRVSLEQAGKWEGVDAVSNPIASYFAWQRTKPWSTCLREYWTRRAEFAVNGNDDKLEAYRKARIGTEFYGFMSLPRELRDMIYRCLCVKGQLYICPEWYNDLLQGPPPHYLAQEERRSGGFKRARLSLPSDALICGVSKTIQHEASLVYYKGTQIVLSDVRYRRDWSTSPKLIFWPYIKDISYAFVKDPMWERIHFWRDPTEVVAPETRKEEHEEVNHLAINEWVSVISDACDLPLDRLQLNFKKSSYGCGGCDLVKPSIERVVDLLKEKHQLPKVIELIDFEYSDNKKGEYAKTLLEDQFKDLVQIRLLSEGPVSPLDGGIGSSLVLRGGKGCIKVEKRP